MSFSSSDDSRNNWRTMNSRNKLRSAVPMIMPLLGFLLTCGGGYMLSTQMQHGQTWIIVPAYAMILIGFVVMLVGVFWAICQSFQNKPLQRGRMEQRIQVFTVERPTTFPPSYEESEGIGASAGAEFTVMVDGVDMVMSLPPPPYSCHATDAPDCRYSWERPPRYSQVERVTRWGEAGTDERTEASSGP